MSAEAVTRPTNEQRITAALWFAEHGFGVFSCWSTRDDGTCRCPKGATCSSAGKHPITEHGFQEATRDPDRIRTALSAASQPNYGLVCPEGVFALDVDGDGVPRLAALEAQHGPLPPTLRVDTANGQHVFLRWPDGLPRPLKQMFGYVTRWGTGRAAGYVIGPASVHKTGKVYRSAPGSTAEIATLPEAWARAAVTPDETIVITAGGDPAAVQVGGRHEWLRDRARFYAGTIRDPGVLRAAVMAENDRLAQPKTPEEVDRAIGDVLERFPADPVEQDPETGRIEHLAFDEIGMLAPAAAGEFPPPPDAAAYRGLLGECAIFLSEGTDASTVGLLGSLLAFAGALIPGQAYQHRMQTTSPFVALVGESSVGRKGTAMWRAHGAMSDALEAVYVNRAILDGVNSGEGLITTLAYKQTAYPYEPTCGLLFEEEYASLLASRARDGSTLDPKLRAAWDGGPLSNRRSNETKTVAPPYWLPALIAITPVELRRMLGADAMQSGSANRWLYLPVVRRDVYTASTPPVLPDEHREALQAARRLAMDGRPVLGTDPAVTLTLSEYQDHVAKVSTGSARDLTRRLPMTAFRLALTHAMAERSSWVTREYLDRALALTEYARAGIDWVFGGTVGNRDADLLLRTLRKMGSLRKRTIEKEIIRDPIRRQDAMDELVRLGYASVTRVKETGGRPRDELTLSPGGGDFARFARVFDMRTDGTQTSLWQKARNEREASFQKVGQGKAEVGQKGSETEGNGSVIDTSTGEVTDRADATWLRRCRDYPRHQDHHRRTSHGWVCAACDKEEERSE